jgi:membrane protease YdiL (CAAX protease family)
VPLVMLLFALSHVPVAGLGLQLIPIAVLSLLAVTARLWTGTWLASVAIHAITNLCIFLPRMMIAFTALKHGVV